MLTKATVQSNLVNSNWFRGPMRFRKKAYRLVPQLERQKKSTVKQATSARLSVFYDKVSLRQQYTQALLFCKKWKWQQLKAQHVKQVKQGKKQ